MSTNKRMVTIAGGGIAGMAAGLALAKAGWHPSIYEQASAFAEVGAGVQLGPNVTRILREWGLLAALNACACEPRHLHARSADTGQVLACMDLHAVGQRYGAPYVSIHRADLHRLLHEAALQQGVQVHAAAMVEALRAQHEAVSALVHEPLGPLQQGRGDADHATASCITSEWAVVADGVWSRLRQRLLAHEPAHWTGHLAYRALMPMDDLPITVKQQVRTDDVTVWMGQDMHLVCYPVCAGQRLNVVCLVQAELPPEVVHVQSWSLQKTPAQTRTDLQLALRGCCGAVHQLIEACDEWRLWPLNGRTPMQSANEHAQGRIALVGDAAHPMLPYLAQGAGMAIEDAQTLAHHVPASNPADLCAGLQAFAHARWQRNARVQRRAMRNGEIFHARGLMRLGRDIGLRAMGASLMDVPWLYGHISP